MLSTRLDGVRRWRYRWQIHRGHFRTPEPELDLLPSLVSPGDWVIDVGANVGHYTIPLAQLVGPSGRVIAFEPIPRTFALLSYVVHVAKLTNVTLLSCAASNTCGVRPMAIPHQNFYRAALSEIGNNHVWTLPLDALPWPTRIRLIKVDAEGHDAAVLLGMMKLIRRDHPTLIVESPGARLEDLRALGYHYHQGYASSNIVFEHGDQIIVKEENDHG